MEPWNHKKESLINGTVAPYCAQLALRAAVVADASGAATDRSDKLGDDAGHRFTIQSVPSVGLTGRPSESTNTSLNALCDTGCVYASVMPPPVALQLPIAHAGPDLTDRPCRFPSEQVPVRRGSVGWWPSAGGGALADGPQFFVALREMPHLGLSAAMWADVAAEDLPLLDRIAEAVAAGSLPLPHALRLEGLRPFV
ncbi:hypothetical protein T492DRAFT_836576 [Pavlovales sp. CCMP2436]|nr:hypothetical protein T492DRAFT_836576 [Pavlovales sp. CCMP2436]